MNVGQFFVTLLCVMTALLTQTGSYSTPDNRCEAHQPDCEYCGDYIDVTLIVRNRLLPPHFESHAMVRRKQGPLRRFLEKAADTHPDIRFNTTYFPGVGYYISDMNNVMSHKQDRTIWLMISDRVGPLECSMCNFIPEDGETIYFNFTTYLEAGIVY